MTFNSLNFIFMFLPAALLLNHYLPSARAKNIMLVVLSFLFYAWGDPAALLLLLISIGWNYLTALQMAAEDDDRKKKHQFVLGIVMNLVILGVFKYTNFILNDVLFLHRQLDIALPVGLSFFLFSEISYLADVYMGKSKASHDLVEYSLYVSFFGKISMGPIVQYHDMEDQLGERTIDPYDAGQGALLFTKGLIKKSLLADQFATLFAAAAGSTSVLGAWLYGAAYMLEIYFDFSGYSDMAIGIGQMFGFHMDPNFNHPYIAKSVQDYWRRWHISLSRWFRDYLYIPLGGSRVSNRKYIRNILIVWFCTGLWHGANWTFILWGLYFGAFTLLEKFYLKDFLSKHTKFGHIYTLLVVLVSWIFFCSPDIGTAFGVIGRLVGIGASAWADGSTAFLLLNNWFLLLLGVLFSMDIFKNLQTSILNRYKKKGITWMTAVYLVGFVLCIAFIVGGTFHPFQYFAF